MLVLSPASDPADRLALDIDSLLTALAREPPQTIAFTEVHTSPLLDRELIVSGTLEYAGPGKLSRVVTTPYSEHTDIDGDLVRIQREGRRERRFSLKGAPELGGLLTGLVAILGGDQTALEREFEVALVGNAADWQLSLTPRSSRARARIELVNIHGRGDTPDCIVTVAKDARSTSELLLGAAAADAADLEQRSRHCAELR